MMHPIELAMHHAGAGDLALAISTIKGALKFAMDDDTLWNCQGVLQQQHGDLVGAKKSFKQAIKLDPKQPDAHGNLGALLLREGDISQAARCLNTAIEIAPDKPECHFNLAELLASQGKYDSAHAEYQAAISLRPGYRKALVGLRNTLPAWRETLQGRTISLAPTTAGDAQFMQACRSDRELMQRVNRSQFQMTAGLDKFYDQSRQTPQRRGGWDWIVRDKMGKPIGWAALTTLNLEARSAEYQIGLIDGYRHGRVGIEATLLLLDFAFSNIGLHRLTALTYDDNEAPQDMLPRLGFTCEGKAKDGYYDAPSDRYIDLHTFRMLDSEYAANEYLQKLNRQLIWRNKQ